MFPTPKGVDPRLFNTHSLLSEHPASIIELKGGYGSTAFLTVYIYILVRWYEEELRKIGRLGLKLLCDSKQQHKDAQSQADGIWFCFC